MTDLNNFRYQPFVAVSGNPGVEVPVVDDMLSSHEQEIYPPTSLDENSFEFEFQTDRNVYVDLRQLYLALKVKLVKGRSFDTYKATEKKKEHKENAVFTETGDDDVEFIEEDEGVPHITHVNNILHSIFSNAELYIYSHQIYNPNGLYAHKSHISNNFKSTLTDNKGVLHCEGYDYAEDPESFVEGPFFTRRKKLYSRPDDFMLYGKLGINFLTTFELLYPNMKVRIRLTGARQNFYMRSENPNVSLDIVDCSLYTRRVMPKEDYHKNKIPQLVYGPVEYNYMETLAKTFIIPARQNQFIQENIFHNAPIRRIAISINSKSAFTGSCAENPFWYQQFNLRDIRILRGGQPTVHHDTTDNCRWYVTTKKAMNFQDDFPSIPNDKFRDHYVLVFDLTSMKDATEQCHYPELIGEPMRLELYFSSPLENVTEVIVLGEVMSCVAVDSLVLWERIFEMDNTFLKQIVNRIHLLKYLYMGSFPSDFVPNLPNDTFMIINTHPSNTPGEDWIRIANFIMNCILPILLVYPSTNTLF